MIRSAILAIYLAVYTAIVAPPLIIYAAITKRVETLYWAGVKGLTFMVRLLGVRTRVEGIENVPPGTCIFASNHTSNADGPVIVGALPRRIAILAKKSLFTAPLIGTAFKQAHFVPLDRSKPERAKASVDLAAKYVREGTSFLIFPEGTRSKDGRLGQFKGGSFLLAIEGGAMVVPVACIGAHRIIPKGSLSIHPGEATVRFCKPIDASAYRPEERAKLAERVRAAIAEALPPDQRPLG
jgi:1-acyl-sn-glycerol-3-phosphate acyltransferase